MASLINCKNGSRQIQFVDGERRTIRLGRLAKRDAESFKSKVEQLVASRISGQAITNEIAEWLHGMPPKYYDKLVDFELVKARDSIVAPQVGAFLDRYIAERSDVKPGTINKFEQVKQNLIECFTVERPIDAITPAGADDFERYLRQKGYAKATVSKRIKIVKQFFRAAVRKGLIGCNPFEDLRAGTQVNRTKDYFVTRDEIQRVLAACPSAEWRLIVALSRYGGLRCESEVQRLTWGDVLWDENKLVIHASKTEHHDDGGIRVIPIFPELLPHLRAAFDEAEYGTKYVIAKYRGNNLRTQFRRIIVRAGITPWAKPFHNMRGTRQTELEDQFPSHVVCAWIGNSESTARRHYLRVTEDHFSKAAGTEAQQYPHAVGRTAPQAERTSHKKPLVLQGYASGCDDMLPHQIGPEGLEPPTKGL